MIYISDVNDLYLSQRRQTVAQVIYLLIASKTYVFFICHSMEMAWVKDYVIQSRAFVVPVNTDVTNFVFIGKITFLLNL